jgi:hypothetical protein
MRKEDEKEAEEIQSRLYLLLWVAAASFDATLIIASALFLLSRGMGGEALWWLPMFLSAGIAAMMAAFPLMERHYDLRERDFDRDQLSENIRLASHGSDPAGEEASVEFGNRRPSEGGSRVLPPAEAESERSAREKDVDESIREGMGEFRALGEEDQKALLLLFLTMEMKWIPEQELECLRKGNDPRERSRLAGARNAYALAATLLRKYQPKPSFPHYCQEDAMPGIREMYREWSEDQGKDEP